MNHLRDPKNFYLIKRDNHYIGAVYDMTNDLHWFVLPQFRKKGILTVALSNVVIPHLLAVKSKLRDKTPLRITIDQEIGKINFEASEKVALNVGFNKTKQFDSKSEYTLSKSYTIKDDMLGQDGKMSNARIDSMRREINFLANSLMLLQTELEMALGIYDYTEELKSLAYLVEEHTEQLDNFWESWNKR